MPTDGQDENPWTRPYTGPVGPPRERLAARPPPPQRSWRRAALPAVLGLTVLAGVGIGVALTREDAPVAPAAPGATVPVEVAALAPPPVQPVGERLEVLSPLPPPPPGLPPLAAAPALAPRVAAPAVRGELASATLPARPASTPAPAPTRFAELSAEPRYPPARDEGQCGWGDSQAQQLVCQDRRLAAADRRMRRAYEAALRAGSPERELAEDQADWLNVREEAARRSTGAVAAIYDQRIDELEALAAPR